MFIAIYPAKFMLKNISMPYIVLRIEAILRQAEQA
jgi:hypothetical protein